MQYLDNKLKNLQKAFRDEREENEYLRLLINDNINRDIHLFEENNMLYSEQTQECVYELLNNDVTTSRVSPVIETVLKLAGVNANKLSSISSQVRVITVFTVFRLLTDFVCLYNYEF